MIKIVTIAGNPFNADLNCAICGQDTRRGHGKGNQKDIINRDMHIIVSNDKDPLQHYCDSSHHIAHICFLHYPALIEKDKETLKKTLNELIIENKPGAPISNLKEMHMFWGKQIEILIKNWREIKFHNDGLYAYVAKAFSGAEDINFLPYVINYLSGYSLYYDMYKENGGPFSGSHFHKLERKIKKEKLLENEVLVRFEIWACPSSNYFPVYEPTILMRIKLNQPILDLNKIKERLEVKGNG